MNSPTFRFASLLAVLTAGAANAQTPSYPNFSSTAGLVLNGTAMQAGSTLSLTSASASQTGTAWFDTPVSLVGGFETTFSFRIPAPGGGADGMAFVIHNDPAGTAAMGEGGGALGYAHDPASAPGTGLVSSVAFEIDTYVNGWGDLDDNSVSVHTNGTAENEADEVYSIGFATAVADMTDASPHTMRVSYVPGTLEVFVDDLVTPLLSIPYDLTTGGMWTNGTPVGGIDLMGGTSAWVGFGAATGGLWENHVLLSWEWGGPPSSALCFGDGTGTACPCGNTGNAGEGCANSTGAGAVLSSSGVSSLSADTFALTAVQTTNQPGVFFQGNNTLAPGLLFGDGLRCCGGSVVRIVTVQPEGNCAASDLSCGAQIGGMGGPVSQHPGNSGLQAGDTRCYQWWYRDPGGSNPCGVDFFNLSNAVEASWSA